MLRRIALTGCRTWSSPVAGPLIRKGSAGLYTTKNCIRRIFKVKPVRGLSAHVAIVAAPLAMMVDPRGPGSDAQYIHQGAGSTRRGAGSPAHYARQACHRGLEGRFLAIEQFHRLILLLAARKDSRSPAGATLPWREPGATAVRNGNHVLQARRSTARGRDARARRCHRIPGQSEDVRCAEPPVPDWLARFHVHAGKSDIQSKRSECAPCVVTIFSGCPADNCDNVSRLPDVCRDTPDSQRIVTATQDGGRRPARGPDKPGKTSTETVRDGGWGCPCRARRDKFVAGCKREYPWHPICRDRVNVCSSSRDEFGNTDCPPRREQSLSTAKIGTLGANMPFDTDIAADGDALISNFKSLHHHNAIGPSGMGRPVMILQASSGSRVLDRTHHRRKPESRIGTAGCHSASRRCAERSRPWRRNRTAARQSAP